MQSITRFVDSATARTRTSPGHSSVLIGISIYPGDCSLVSFLLLIRFTFLADSERLLALDPRSPVASPSSAVAAFVLADWFSVVVLSGVSGYLPEVRMASCSVWTDLRG
jgi:hypothetical protein